MWWFHFHLPGMKEAVSSFSESITSLAGLIPFSPKLNSYQTSTVDNNETLASLIFISFLFSHWILASSPLSFWVIGGIFWKYYIKDTHHLLRVFLHSDTWHCCVIVLLVEENSDKIWSLWTPCKWSLHYILIVFNKYKIESVMWITWNNTKETFRFNVLIRKVLSEKQ